MTKTSCPNCGAPVNNARDVDSGENVPLEVYADSSTDAQRYAIVGFDPLRVRKVAPGASGNYLPDHRSDCPSHGAGRG